MALSHCESLPNFVDKGVLRPMPDTQQSWAGKQSPNKHGF